MERRALVVTGGTSDYQFQRAYLGNKSFDCIIAADKGVEAVFALGLVPDVILGDFDSVNSSALFKAKTCEKTKVLTYPAEKDYTDTHLAVQSAIEAGATAITILGATGTRIDHVLANIDLLSYALNQGVRAEIIDANNKIYAVNKEKQIEKSKQFGKYISLIPYTDVVSGITLTGFKYPLTNQSLTKNTSLGISNEVIKDQAFISLKQGTLLVIESKD